MLGILLRWPFGLCPPCARNGSHEHMAIQQESPAYVLAGHDPLDRSGRFGTRGRGVDGIECGVCYCPSEPPQPAQHDAAKHMAVLMLGHRDRLIFDTLPNMVVLPTARSGVGVVLFAILEAQPMVEPYTSVGGRITPHPVYGALDDNALVGLLGALVRAAGGKEGKIVIRGQPRAKSPNRTRTPLRFWMYDQHVLRTVAICLLKELHGYRLIQEYELREGARFDWILQVREDSHWFAPFNLSFFEPGYVHGKSCSTYGGWNDHIYLIWRSHAKAMLTSYNAMHTPASELPVSNRCWRRDGPRHLAAINVSDNDKGLPRKGGGSSTLSLQPLDADSFPVDALACKTMEQWRERVGRVWRVPYRENSPMAFPSTDVRLVLAHASRSWDLLQSEVLPPTLRTSDANKTPDATSMRAVTCFPGAYAFGSSLVVGQRLNFERGRGICVPHSMARFAWELGCERLSAVSSPTARSKRHVDSGIERRRRAHTETPAAATPTTETLAARARARKNALPALFGVVGGAMVTLSLLYGIYTRWSVQTSRVELSS